MATINTIVLAGTIREPSYTASGGHFYLEVDKYVYNEGYKPFRIPVIIPQVQDKHQEGWLKSQQKLLDGAGAFVEGKLDVTGKGTIVVSGKPKATYFGEFKKAEVNPGGFNPDGMAAASIDDQPPF